MAVTVLDAELMASIRTLLGVDAATLPDAVLTDPLLGGAVEAEVLAAIGGLPYAQRPEAEQAAIRRAVAYEAAARALESGPLREALSLTSERFSDQYQVQRNATEVDRRGWVSRLRAQGRAALEPLLPKARASFLGMFALAHGGRGA